MPGLHAGRVLINLVLLRLIDRNSAHQHTESVPGQGEAYDRATAQLRDAAEANRQQWGIHGHPPSAPAPSPFASASGGRLEWDEGDQAGITAHVHPSSDGGQHTRPLRDGEFLRLVHQQPAAAPAAAAAVFDTTGEWKHPAFFQYFDKVALLSSFRDLSDLWPSIS